VKLLIVDDSAIGRVVVQRNCLGVGLREDEIVHAENGQSALQRFDRDPCDAIVTDWHMPVMDGLTLVREIRKRDPHVPILMFTASCSRDEVVAAVEAGANDYLVKPFAPGDLQRKLRKLLALVQNNEAQASS
jgi:two-component system, chemotaxis family, chemotaxis protein CheY